MGQTPSNLEPYPAPANDNHNSSPPIPSSHPTSDFIGVVGDLLSRAGTNMSDSLTGRRPSTSTLSIDAVGQLDALLRRHPLATADTAPDGVTVVVRLQIQLPPPPHASALRLQQAIPIVIYIHPTFLTAAEGATSVVAAVDIPEPERPLIRVHPDLTGDIEPTTFRVLVPRGRLSLSAWVMAIGERLKRVTEPLLLRQQDGGSVSPQQPLTLRFSLDQLSAAIRQPSWHAQNIHETPVSVEALLPVPGGIGRPNYVRLFFEPMQPTLDRPEPVAEYCYGGWGVQVAPLPDGRFNPTYLCANRGWVRFSSLRRSAAPNGDPPTPTGLLAALTEAFSLGPPHLSPASGSSGSFSVANPPVQSRLPRCTVVGCTNFASGGGPLCNRCRSAAASAAPPTDDSPPPIRPVVDPPAGASLTSAAPPVATGPTRQQDDDDANLCVICLSERRQLACVPCGHLALCSSCKDEFMKRPVCPMCRAAVASLLRVFM